MASQGVTLGRGQGHKEVAQGGSSKLRCCVQMNAFVKQPDPPWTREQGAALSEIDNEEQVSLQSSATASGNAQRTDDTAAWKAGIALLPAERTQNLRSPWRCDSQRKIWHGGQFSALGANRDH